MTERLFGTDGIRGVALEPPLDASTVSRLGAALAAHLLEQGRPSRILLAGDTRASTPLLAGWLASGVRSAGGEVLWGDVLPTPAVSRLLRELGGFGAGVVVSASHNPARDNGIKLVTGSGTKWPVAEERRLEERLAKTPEPYLAETIPAPNVDLAELYVALLHRTLPAGCLDGVHLVVDAAHGAASWVAESFLAGLGAQVDLMAASPDGTNINEGCGALFPEELAAAVTRHHAGAGIAFDGDADRAVLVTHRGRILNGDDLLLMWGRDLARTGALPRRALVATVMSNIGLEVALARDGLGLVRCPVGDREVWETMQREELVLGGEQSGHIICSHHATTGDGLLTAAHVLAIAARSGRRLEEMADLQRFPQVLLNIQVARRAPIEEVPALAEVVQEHQRRLDGQGRLVVRYSGTEPLLRIMVEAPTQADADRTAEDVAAAARHQLGVPA